MPFGRSSPPPGRGPSTGQSFVSRSVARRRTPSPARSCSRQVMSWCSACPRRPSGRPSVGLSVAWAPPVREAGLPNRRCGTTTSLNFSLNQTPATDRAFSILKLAGPWLGSLSLAVRRPFRWCWCGAPEHWLPANRPVCCAVGDRGPRANGCATEADDYASRPHRFGDLVADAGSELHIDNGPGRAWPLQCVAGRLLGLVLPHRGHRDRVQNCAASPPWAGRRGSPRRCWMVRGAIVAVSKCWPNLVIPGTQPSTAFFGTLIARSGGPVC